MENADAGDNKIGPARPSLDRGESPFAATGPLTFEPVFSGSPFSDHSSLAIPVTVGFVAIALIGNCFGTWFFWETADSELLLFPAIGAMLAEPCLVAVWLALGYQQVVLRIPLATGVLLSVVLAYLHTLNLLDPGNLPLEVTIFFSLVAAVIFAVLQIPFWIFRLTSRQVITTAGKSGNVDASQFGIRHLMITMTVAAVIVLLVKNVIPEGSWEGGAPWKQMIRFVSPYLVGICILAILCTALVFSEGNRGLLLIVIVGVVMAGSISLYFMPENGPLGLNRVDIERFVRNACLFFVGFLATMIGVLSVYYRIGFRLRGT